MLVEIWEWLRGYSKWPQVEAKVEFQKDEHIYHDKNGKELHYSHITGELLVWTDPRGDRRQAPLKPPGGDDPKYQFTDGEIVAIRCNPANPEQYYFRMLSEMKVRRFFSVTFTVIGVAIFSIGSVWIREMLGCSR